MKKQSSLDFENELVTHFLQLAKDPDPIPDDTRWFALRNRCDLPWSQLLAAQPQFAIHCDLKKLYPDQRCKLLKHQSGIFAE